jgi:uncharacterized protein (TIGR03435 family)
MLFTAALLLKTTAVFAVAAVLWIYQTDIRHGNPSPRRHATPATPLKPTILLRSTVEDLGLKLEPTRLPIEVLIMERVERPSEN